MAHAALLARSTATPDPDTYGDNVAFWFNTKHFGVSSRGRVSARVGPVRAYGGGRRRSSSGGGAGLLGLLVAVGLVFAALICVAALPGHLLGWTPSVGQIFKSSPPPGYIHARYRNIALGFILTAVLLTIVLVWLLRIARTEQPIRLTVNAALAISCLVAVQHATHTGARAHLLTPAATVGVYLTPSQTAALRTVADRAVRAYGGTGPNLADDVAYTHGWRTLPRTCRFANYSDGALTSWNFTCVVDAVNPRVHRSTVFRVAVTCWRAVATVKQCASSADSVTDTRRPVSA